MINSSVIKPCFRNLIGTSEIDVQSVELLPGASSALYEVPTFNGILYQ
jgi:hypothetical protein